MLEYILQYHLQRNLFYRKCRIARESQNISQEGGAEKNMYLSAVTASIKGGNTDVNSEWMTAIKSEVKAGQQLILAALMKAMEAKPFISETQNAQVSYLARLYLGARVR